MLRQRTVRIPRVYRLLIELESDPEFLNMLPDLTQLNNAARPIMLVTAIFNDLLFGNEHGIPLSLVASAVARRRRIRPLSRNLINYPDYIALMRFGTPLLKAHLIRIDELAGIPEILMLIEAQKYFTIPLTVIIDCNVRISQRKIISFTGMAKLLDDVRLPGPRLFANIDMCSEVIRDEERGITIHQCSVVDGRCVPLRDVRPEDVDVEMIYARHIVDKSGHVRTIVAYTYNMEKLLADNDLLYSWGLRMGEMPLVTREKRESPLELVKRLLRFVK